ncbi:hypothetical protein [Hansschlegelia sp. KR7-227]|uniref:hypothetical protein n=1 Tax=Hansschlegelia sp. KR7-227 TaxID=3400914 RepID=UPI003C0161CA
MSIYRTSIERFVRYGRAGVGTLLAAAVVAEAFFLSAPPPAFADNGRTQPLKALWLAGADWRCAEIRGNVEYELIPTGAVGLFPSTSAGAHGMGTISSLVLRPRGRD